MFCIFIFLAFDRNQLDRTLFQTLVFLNRKICLISRKFYSLDSRVNLVRKDQKNIPVYWYLHKNYRTSAFSEFITYWHLQHFVD